MSFRKDVVSIQLTTFLNILAGLIYFPILARIFRFPPESFGQFQYVNSISMLIMSFALLSLDVAFISETEEQDEKQTSIAFSTIVFLGISLFGFSTISLLFFQWLGFLRLEGHFICFVFLAGVCLVLERAFYSLFREKRLFATVAKARVLITISHPLTGCVLAYFFRSVYALLIAFAFSHLLGALFYYWAAKARKIMPVFMLNIQTCKEFIKKNWNTVAFQTPSGFLNSFYHNLPVLLIRRFFSAEVLGFYALSMRVLGTTNRLLSQGLYETFLPYVAKSEKNREYALVHFPLICAVFFPPFLAATLLSPWYVDLLFGQSFHFVSEIIKIMGPFYFTQAVVGPYIGFILIYRRSELNLAINSGGVILRAVVFLFGSWAFGLTGALYSISIGGIAVYQTFLVTATSLSGQPVRQVSLSLLPYQFILFAVPLGLVPLWSAPVLFLPSIYVVYKNREILFPKHKQVPPSKKTTD